LFFLLAGAVLVLGGREAGPAPAPAGKPGFRQLRGFGKYRVVRINPDGIFPRDVRIQEGATVIWYNATAGYSSVIFNDGEALSGATESPTLFFLAPDGTYVSAAIGSGATASTAFVKKGRYRYFVTGLPASEGAAFASVVVE